MIKPPGRLVEVSPPSAAAALPTRASTLRRHWLDSAFLNAKIDASHWDPTRGVDINRRTIERAYDYYGRLYVHHARLEWAGMANMIGPSFYAGFLDVAFLPDQMRRVLEEAAARCDGGPAPRGAAISARCARRGAPRRRPRVLRNDISDDAAQDLRGP